MWRASGPHPSPQRASPFALLACRVQVPSIWLVVPLVGVSAWASSCPLALYPSCCLDVLPLGLWGPCPFLFFAFLCKCPNQLVAWPVWLSG